MRRVRCATGLSLRQGAGTPGCFFGSPALSSLDKRYFHGAQPCVVLQELCEAASSQRLDLLWLIAGVLGSA